LLILLLTSDRGVMGDLVSSKLTRVLGWITLALMTGAAVAMIVA
jgi:Mn2+/Fe2+ NRAMP family transporter